jgi:uncharacterized protein YdhG (YjbR/CyaY superfamily)
VPKKRNISTVAEYINSRPQDVQRKLNQLRSLIQQVAPEAEERISYQMPAYFHNGVLVWFAAHSNHIGFYPRATAITRFERELSRFKHSKGTVQFPLDQPLPVELIKKMVRFRLADNVKAPRKQTK